MRMERAWQEWWESLGHVAQCNRDAARTCEAFEAGYLAASRTGGATVSPSSDAAKPTRARPEYDVSPPLATSGEADQISIEDLGAQPPPFAGKQQV